MHTEVLIQKQVGTGKVLFVFFGLFFPLYNCLKCDGTKLMFLKFLDAMKLT